MSWHVGGDNSKLVGIDSKFVGDKLEVWNVVLHCVISLSWLSTHVSNVAHLPDGLSWFFRSPKESFHVFLFFSCEWG